MADAELRTDLWTGRQVIVAGDRAGRPQMVKETASRTDDSLDAAQKKHDPFLEGREDRTPGESLSLRHQNSEASEAGWLVRIVPNRYPAVADFSSRLSNAARGIHDVVIECPDFRKSWLQFSVTEIGRVLIAWQRRHRMFANHPEVQAIQTFRNQGESAGASLPHSHSQLVALADIPPLLRDLALRTGAFDFWLKTEFKEGRRIISQEDFIVVCPSAGLMTGQIRICQLPEACQSRSTFADFCESKIPRLAATLQSCMRAVSHCFPEAGLNVVLHQAPVRNPGVYPWSIDIFPRTSCFAGFELGCDVPIITVPPEQVADDYRAVWQDVFPDQKGVSSRCQQLWPKEYSWRMNDSSGAV